MINLDKISNLLGNDKQIVSRFLDLYIEKVPHLINKLGDELSNNDYTAAGITAHEIKSQSAYLGLDDIVTLASKIEDEADQQKNEYAKEYFEKLSKHLDNALSELRAII